MEEEKGAMGKRLTEIWIASWRGRRRRAPLSLPPPFLPTTKKHRSAVHLQIADALERIVAGPEKTGAVISEKKKKLVAYHEAR